MRIVFFGTPEFAVPSLRTLISEGHEVVGVVTQPDKPRGRSRSVLVPPPVKSLSLEHGLPVLQPDSPTGDLFSAALRRLRPEIGVVVAYGHILRPGILELPDRGMVNVHASLLPRWRGAAPIQKAILEGDPITGVSVMQMAPGMDTGPVLHRLQTTIREGETAGELSPRLADLGALGLMTAIEALQQDTATFEIQDEAAATHATKVTRAMARVDWHDPAERVARQTLAYDPAPGSWTQLGDAPVKLFHGEAMAATAAAGTILAAGDKLLVACGSGAVAIREVQPSGKKRLSVADWTRGRDDLPGLVLE